MIPRLAVAALALVALTACETASSLGEGDANYDALKQATERCRAEGGEIRLKDHYDGRQLSSYVCQRVKARQG
ncbi:MAG: hypothetical protein ABI376_04560 [Caulobacteraceae bacterium]